MGFISGIATDLYRYIRYGGQFGKTANNGTKVYKRFGRTTAINANNEVIRTTQKRKVNDFTMETKVIDYLPFNQKKVGFSRVTRDGDIFQGGLNWQEPFNPKKVNAWNVSLDGKVYKIKW